MVTLRRPLYVQLGRRTSVFVLSMLRVRTVARRESAFFAIPPPPMAMPRCSAFLRTPPGLTGVLHFHNRKSPCQDYFWPSNFYFSINFQNFCGTFYDLWDAKG